ncbi:hypothetical protein CPB97_006180 [Podila verticillata]|nr:hypothetical protein CPB97_006180 [Podila verticillata]
MDQKEQRLPNECLLLVIQTFASDLKTLRKLLLVNRLFFHAVVPLMLDDPIETWDILEGRPNAASGEKLMALIFASVVSHNRGPPTTTGDSDPAATASRLTANLLAPFNLQVADVICMPIVQRIMEDPGNKTTIDYSRHFRHLGTFVWGENVYAQFVQLLRPPLQALDSAQQMALFSHFGAADEFRRNYESDEDIDESGGESDSQDDEEDDEDDDDQYSLGCFGRAIGPRSSNANMTWTVNFGMRFSIGLRAGAAGVQDGFGDDDSDHDNSDIEVESDPIGGLLESHSEIKTSDWDEASARYFDEFGTLSPINVDDSEDRDMKKESDGQDPAHKMVLKLGKRTYKKWQRTMAQQMFEGYRDVICQSFINLLLHYNADVILNIHFHLKDAHHYLVSASKLSQLNEIFVSRDKTVWPRALDTAKNFLRDHREAFPNKRNLDLVFGPGWVSRDHQRLGSAELQRRALIEFERPRMELYNAFQYPRIIAVEESPNFYESCVDINFSHLEGFRDDDDDRFASGKGPAQEQVLRQCINLRRMILAIDSPQQLAWMLPSASTAGEGSATGEISTVHLGQLHRPLAKLEMLALTSRWGSGILLHVANTTMKALNDSTHLRDFKLQGKHEEAREHNGSEGLALTTTVGGWNMPAVRSIMIDVQDLDDLHVNSWDQCPLLERLRIYCAPLLDASPRSGNTMQLSIYQPWNLPHLKLLQLSNLPALLFNYDSLKMMTSLKVLVLTSMYGVNVPGSKAEMWRCTGQIPRLSAYLPSKLKKEESTSVAQEKWTVDWNMPHLTTIVMRGPPAMTFSMDWLKCCPVLDKVSLKIEHGYWQPLPLLADNPVEWIKSPEESRLREFTLQGKWAMREEEITAFLTDYAPNLVKFEVDWIHRNRNASAGALMKVIDNADKIILERAKRTCIRQPRLGLLPLDPEIHYRKLTHVVANYRMAPRELYSWKTMEIESDDVPKLQKHHVRVYEFANAKIISGRTHHQELVALANKPQYDMMNLVGAGY